jgi:spore germination protein KA
MGVNHLFGKLKNLVNKLTQKNTEAFSEITDMALNSASLKVLLSGNSDVSIKNINIGSNPKLKTTLFYIDGMVDTKLLDDNILKPLLQEKEISDSPDENKMIYNIVNGLVYHAKILETDSLADCVKQIILGSAAIVFDGINKAVTFEVKGFEKRAVTEPTNESIIKGSKESFVELLKVNTSMVRRKIRTHKLKIEQVIVGRQSITPVAILYIDGITNMRIVDELRHRLQSIDIDGALMAGNIEEYIIDNKFTPYPQTAYTERVDSFCNNLLEGRVGMLIDGLPVSYNVPVTFDMFFRAPEDYASNYLISSAIRLIRYISAIITIIMPAFYISITTFHQEMIPSKLAVSIINSKQGVPFPTFIEVLMLLLSFEILLEAGLRLPKPIGQALSIVGALIVGEAAVNARIVSPIVVIVIALTVICGFVIPCQDMSNVLRLVRLFFVLISSAFGLFGLALGIIVTGIHISQLQSFGVPYFAPFSSSEGKGIFADTVFRLPLFMIKTRPENLKTTNKKRQQ